jgi:hypothetical protein
VNQTHKELILILLSALIVLAISVVWLINSAGAWQAHQVERLLKNGHLLSRETLMRTLEKSRDLDKAFIPGSHLHAPALLAANIPMASEDADQAVNQKILSDARESAKRALSREPADALAWAQLAYFTYILDGPSREALNSLRMSIYIAPYKYNLIFWRIEMAALNGAFWDNQMADLVRRQILIAWSADPDLLAQTAIDYGLVPFTREILSADPEKLNQFETLINRQESP